MNTVIQKYETASAEYLAELTRQGLSENSIHNYEKRMRLFKEFWIGRNPKTDPTCEDVKAWRDSLLEKGSAASTVKQYLVELKAFFNYACDEDRSDSVRFSGNPVKAKIYPVVKKKPYENVFTPEDLKKLWVNKTYRTKDSLWDRNYAIITLLLDGKIRQAELLDLRLSDVHFADQYDPYDYVIVRKGKGDKYREVDLNQISVTALKLYLKSGIRPEGLSDDDPLFGTTAEKVFGGTTKGVQTEWHKMSGAGLSKLVESHVRNVTGKAGFRTHSLRHNGAIMDLNNGISTEELQAELGHSSITTTQIYSGRLQSKRNRKNMADVIAARDEWAEKNQAMLEKEGEKL